MSGTRLGICHVLLWSGAAGEGMDRNSGAGQNLHCRADTATVCRAEACPSGEWALPPGVVAGSFDRVARRRLTSLDKVNRDSMRRSGHGGSSLHELITIS